MSVKNALRDSLWRPLGNLKRFIYVKSFYSLITITENTKENNHDNQKKYIYMVTIYPLVWGIARHRNLRATVPSYLK